MNARVEPRIAQVDEEVDYHVGQGKDQDQRLHHLDVSRDDRDDEVASHPIQPEDRLDQDGAADQA